MRYNLRFIIAWTTISAILMAIFRRPLAWLWASGADSGIVQAFINPFRHLAWIAGDDVEYFPGSETWGNAELHHTLGEFFATIAGATASLFLHIAIVCFLLSLFASLLDWASPEVEGDDESEQTNAIP